MHVAALSSIIRWDRQLWVGGVLNCDGLRRGCVVAALVRCGERACHHVAVRASEDGVSNLFNGCHAAVVRRSRLIQGVRIAALSSVVCWDGHHWACGVFDGERGCGLGGVAALVHGHERDRH